MRLLLMRMGLWRVGGWNLESEEYVNGGDRVGRDTRMGYEGWLGCVGSVRTFCLSCEVLLFLFVAHLVAAGFEDFICFDISACPSASRNDAVRRISRCS